MKLFKTVLSILILVVGISAQGDVKTSYGILLDNTGSMRTQLELVRELADGILKEVGAAPVSIFAFVATDRVASAAFGLECVTDRDRLTKQIGEIGTVPGQTTLGDAVNAASSRLKESAMASCGNAEERILVVLSDGEDRSSNIQGDELFRQLRASGVRIYVIGLTAELGPSTGYIFKASSGKSKEFLRRLASETNGRIVFPKKKEKPREVVERLFSANYKADK